MCFTFFYNIKMLKNVTLNLISKNISITLIDGHQDSNCKHSSTIVKGWVVLKYIMFLVMLTNFRQLLKHLTIFFNFLLKLFELDFIRVEISEIQSISNNTV